MNGYILVTIAVPAGTTNSPALLEVESLSTKEEVSAGFVNLEVTMRDVSNGKTVSDLNKTIEIHYWVTFNGSTPTLKDVGDEAKSITRILTPMLISSENSSYFVHPDSTFSIYTRKLSSFQFLIQQNALQIFAKTRNIKVGNTVQLQVAGGSGDGAVEFYSITQDTCSLGSTGKLLALSAGKCQIYAQKSGLDKFLVQKSEIYEVRLYESAQQLLERTSKRNWLIYSRLSSGYQVKVNLAEAFGNQSGVLQYRTYIKGRLVYLKLADLQLDASGDSLFVGTQDLLSGTRLRFVLNGSNIKYSVSI